jgi:alkaline phosphatase
VAHTRRRTDYDPIVQMFFESGVDVLMGGGAAHFLPRSVAGAKRKDDVDYVARFRDAGYAIATTEQEMKVAAARPEAKKLLGLFHPGKYGRCPRPQVPEEGDRGTVSPPTDLGDMVTSALQVLSRHDRGFVLLVESGLIDKFSHPLDWERAVMDIMLDRAVEVAKRFAATNADTLILVTADHIHGLSIVGTIDDGAPGP